MDKLNSILLVDDDPTWNFINKTIARNYAQEVQSCYNGSQALDYIVTRDFNPDLIIVDMHMPIMDGFEFAKRYNQLSLPWKAPIIILTSYPAEKDFEKARQLGIRYMIDKPMEEVKLQEIIQAEFEQAIL